MCSSDLSQRASQPEDSEHEHLNERTSEMYEGGKEEILSGVIYSGDCNYIQWNLYTHSMVSSYKNTHSAYTFE